jgi:E3 ubiquitin-protein ligase TRIP12
LFYRTALSKGNMAVKSKAMAPAAATSSRLEDNDVEIMDAEEYKPGASEREDVVEQCRDEAAEHDDDNLGGGEGE